MTDGIASCAAAMEMEQHRLETSAENLANLETDGFHRHLERASGGKSGEALPMRPTGRKLDVAITGDSLLKFAPPRGKGFDAHAPVEARAASLHRDDAGHLLDPQGRALLGVDGRPVVVPAGAEPRSDGSFVLEHTTVAKIPVAAGAELRSGFVEGSDVNSIGEMIVVLDAQRQYETASKVLQSLDTARQKSANDVGKIQQ